MIKEVENIRSTVYNDCFFQANIVISRLSSVGRAYDCNRHASHCMVAGSIPAVEKIKLFPVLAFFCTIIDISECLWHYLFDLCFRLNYVTLLIDVTIECLV